MNKERGQNDNKYIAAIKIYFAIAVAAIFVFLVLAQVFLPDERETYQSECRVFEAEWERVSADGERVPITYPGKLPAERGEVVVIATTLPDEIRDGEALCFSPVWQNIRIYVGDDLRVQYDTKDSRPFGTNSPQRNLFVRLNNSDAGKELVLQFSSDSKYAGDLRTVYIGDTLSIWMFLLHESGIQTIIAVFMAFMSLFCIVISLVLKLVYHKMLPLSYLAWTILFCALWVLSEVDIRQLLIPNISAFTNLTYWCLMLIPLPMIMYMNEIQEYRYKKLYTLPLVYASVVFGVGTLLQVLDIAQFVQQLSYVHIGIAITIVSVIGAITVDVFKKKIYDYIPVAVGAYGLLVTAVLEMVLYYMDIGVTLGTVLLVGLMFLLIMAIIKTGQDLLRSEQKKQQAIAARASQAKFLANMSHEIRTPINAVIGMNEMILRESNDINAIQEYARNVQSASTMLLGLVNDILDFSKIESGQLELVEDTYNIAELIETEILLLKARANDKAIATKLDVSPYIPSKLYGDELRIKQIVTNILSNAVKYTQEGSVSFMVSFEWTGVDTINLCFTVTDTGTGIHEEDLSKLFDSFKRLEQNKNRNIEGTGLGLNIAKQLVDQMQGKIHVESEYGKGSTFYVTIPQKVIERTPMGSRSASQKQEQKQEVLQKRFTAPDAHVLAVDDNTMNLAVIKGLLRRTKVQLDLAVSGQECLDRTSEKKYDIILMDHMMPDLDGVETLHLLRKDKTNPNSSTVVIALTANAVAGCKEMYLAYGFDEYASKPIEAEKLELLLARLLPENLVIYEGTTVAEQIQDTRQAAEQNEISADTEDANLLMIDRTVGLSYVMDSEELYQEILQAFCEQIEEYLPQLETCYEEKNWSAYAVLAHAIKGNACNIGAVAFSEFSKKQELAAKENDEAVLISDYAVYREMLIKLAKNVKEMIQ